jgi:hypothetical protein
MKTVISIVVGLALVLSVVPAIAGDTFIPATARDSFRALGNMPAGEQELLTPLSDEQLAVIEGEGAEVCTFCSNYAAVYQANINYWGKRTRQTNVAVVKQEIN